MIHRIVEARAEIVGLINMGMAAAIAFGASLTDEQTIAVVGMANAAMFLFYRLVKGKAVSAPPAQ